MIKKIKLGANNYAYVGGAINAMTQINNIIQHDATINITVTVGPIGDQ